MKQESRRNYLSSIELKQIRELPGNELCCDCNSKDPQWVSLTFGTLICLDCSGKHRALGCHISFVRSLKLDTFSKDEVRILLSSSNSSFQKHLAVTYLSQIPINIKYSSLEAYEYKSLLDPSKSPLSKDDVTSLISLSDYAASSFRKPIDKPFNWVEDKKSDRCMQCDASFSLFQRKHHCRKCGDLVCSSCAPKKNSKPVHERGIMKPVRHCKLCYKSPIIDWDNL
eukprot:maker-scaffold_8-snap-gene-11.32-mRNA-1 protein AED:0.00 eAED:0.00 QI:32/1/1/1/1/1/2/40/225